MAFELRLLGPAEVILPNGETAPLPLGKPLGVLIYVALSRQPLSREEVAEIFWPDAGREKALHSLRQALWVLKTTMEEDLFESSGPLALREGVLQTDLAKFHAALEQGDTDEARSLWRGHFLEGFVVPSSRQWNHWTEDRRSHLVRRFQRALLHRAQELRREELPNESLECLSFALALNPASDSLHKARINLLLEMRRLKEARAALADAWTALGDAPEARENLQRLEEDLTALAQKQRAEQGSPETLELEFVGRSRELAVLHKAREESFSGRPRIVAVTGPAGIGKTRLAEEFFRSIDEAEALRLVVKGSRAEMKLRWGGVARLVRQALLLPGSAGISSASDSLLRAMIPSLGRGEVNLETVNGVSPAALLDAVRDLLDAVSFELPLAVHLDDFQWFDGESRNLLLSLLTRPGNLRTLFVVNGRPDLSSTHWKRLHASLIQDAGAAGITLEPLTLGDVRELLALMGEFSNPDQAESAVQRLHRASGGNPLFLRGLLGQLMDQGILQRSGEEWTFDTESFPERFSFPEDIRALLNQRLDRLSPSGAQLAGTLARYGRPMSISALERAMGRDSGEVTEAVAELMEREVVRWVNAEEVDFVHDLLREAAAVHLRLSGSGAPSVFGRPGSWTRRVAGAVAVTVLLAVPLGILWGRGGLEPGPEAPLPRYGGGTLLLLQPGATPLAEEVTAAPPESWKVDSLPGAPLTRLAGASRNPDGSITWYAREDHPKGPDVIRIDPDGSRVTVFPAPGDQTFKDVSPDGRRILFLSEDPDFDGFSQDLYWGVPETGAIHRVQKAHGGFIVSGRWSPDGDLIAFAVQAKVDTLVVSDRWGRRVGSQPVGEVRKLAWCEPDIFAVARPDEGIVLLRVRPPELAMDTVTRLDAWTDITCSPDGGAVVYRTVSGTRMPLVLRDLATGEVHPLGLPGEVADSWPLWLPPRPASIPIRIEVGEDTVRLGWGERRELSAKLRFSDGSDSVDGVRWESLDPAVATVTATDRVLTGNGVGVTRVLARWGYSLADTIRVEVADQGRGGALYRDRFTHLDTARWLPVGHPAPRPDHVGEDEPVLRLRGSEKYAQGILYRPGIGLEQGATVELELHMIPNRPVHQNFQLCVSDLDLKEADTELGKLPPVHQQACFNYPAHEYDKMDSAEASFAAGGGVEVPVHFPEALPARDWTHVAIEVRADGQAALVVNRRVVAVSPLRLRVRPDRQWTISLVGDAIGTDLLVRNLAIWGEVRYGSPEDR